MSEVEIIIYDIKEIEDESEKGKKVTDSLKKINSYDEADKIKLAKYIKKYFEIKGEWKVGIHKKNKKTKKEERIEKICSILGEEIPTNNK